MKKLLFLFLLFSFSSSNPDFQALLSFKTSSDPSNSLSSWSNSTHHCSWLGVSCNPNTSRVTKLTLQHLNLTGSIQPLTHLTHLRLLSLQHNNFSSSTLDFSLLTNLKLLYLSHNQFSGEFPPGLTQLHRLRRIDLSYNRLYGEIPINRLAQLPHLLTLRLESNFFTGWEFVDQYDHYRINSFQTLMDFNVSDNHISGQIPKPLSSFSSSCFGGNSRLCGEPLLTKCSNHTSQNDPIPGEIFSNHRNKKMNVRSILVILLVDFVVVGLIGAGLFMCCLRIKRRDHGIDTKENDMEVKRRVGYENENEEMVLFEGAKRFKVDELLKASAEMLGKGSVGSTYKVVMDSGDVVVVKRAKEKRKKKEIEGLLKEIGGLRHSNIIGLRAYYCSRDELLLVYDFLPNGSLHSLLHGNRGPGRTPVEWAKRLKLALGIAEGLMYLHNNARKSKLCHGHLTSRNVVIDQEGNACISDVGLHQLFVIATPTNTEYTAPELMPTTHSSRKSSHKSDVYSFGVVLLEILTGKKAASGGETSLIKFVQSVAREEWTSEVFDFELLRYKETEKEMVALLHVALLCVTPSPPDRPNINEVHKMIKDI